MELIRLSLFILLIGPLSLVDSIQCCTGDKTCSAKPIDCPSNVCFKLVLSKDSEERGCMRDLIKLVNLPKPGSRQGTDADDPDGVGEGGGSSTNDQCQKLGAQDNGMSLCKCTNDLCNSASRVSLTFSQMLFFLLLIFN